MLYAQMANQLDSNMVIMHLENTTRDGKEELSLIYMDIVSLENLNIQEHIMAMSLNIF